MQQPLLELDDLCTWFPVRRGVFGRTADHVRAVDGVRLTVDAGEIVGLVGESGCGKTTLGRTVLGLEQPRSGQIRFAGADVLALPAAARRDLCRELQVIFQDPASALNPRMTVLDIVTEGPAHHGLLTGNRQEAALRILEKVGLGPDHLHRYPHEFSGGQRQRICIARAIAVQPKLIICDEPVSALDVSVQAQVINLLLDLRDSEGLSYLFISHDLSVVRQIADRVAVMYLGRIVECGPTAEVIEQPRHPYTRALLAAVPTTTGARAATTVARRGTVAGGAPGRLPVPPALHPRRDTLPQRSAAAGGGGREHSQLPPCD
jgi:oligopeptide/dipeptide ABC transporter ATP-binding protein